MALKVYDGFDHYATQTDLQSRVGAVEWNDIFLGTAGNPIVFPPGRGGFGFALGMPTSSGVGSRFGGSFNANYTTGYVRWAVQFQAAALVPFIDMALMDYTAQAPQITFRMYSDSGSIILYLGDPVNNQIIASTPPNAFSPYIWNMVEIGGTIGSSGSVAMQVAGSAVISVVGTNIQATANNYFNGLRVVQSVGAGQNGVYLDDFSLNDGTTGPGTFPCNGFLGDTAVRTLFATANSSVTWTPLTGANWQEISEVHFDGDTSYNFATTVGNTDLFTFGSLPTTTSAVFAVQTTGGYRKLDAGAQTIVQEVKSGGTTSSGGTWSLSLNYSYVTDLFVLDPNTSATWTTTAVNAVIAGYKLNS